MISHKCPWHKFTRDARKTSHLPKYKNVITNQHRVRKQCVWIDWKRKWKTCTVPNSIVPYSSFEWINGPFISYEWQRYLSVTVVYVRTLSDRKCEKRENMIVVLFMYFTLGESTKTKALTLTVVYAGGCTKLDYNEQLYLSMSHNEHEIQSYDNQTLRK